MDGMDVIPARFRVRDFKNSRLEVGVLVDSGISSKLAREGDQCLGNRLDQTRRIPLYETRTWHTIRINTRRSADHDDLNVCAIYTNILKLKLITYS
eukprot:6179997-Pleurochrysis_carterae.AAC.1